MRDDQIVNLIRKEMEHVDNISMLRYQQVKIQIDAITSAIGEPWLLFRCIFQPHLFRIRVDEIYEIKAQSFNERLQSELAKEKLKI